MLMHQLHHHFTIFGEGKDLITADLDDAEEGEGVEGGGERAPAHEAAGACDEVREVAVCPVPAQPQAEHHAPHRDHRQVEQDEDGDQRLGHGQLRAQA